MAHTRKVVVQFITFFLGIACLLSACGINKHSDSVEENFEMDDSEQTNLVYFSCENELLSAYFHADKAQISWLGKSHLLTQAVSASGVFYLGEEASLSILGHKAELQLQDSKTIPCRIAKIES